MKHKGSDCDLTQSEETGNNFNEKFSHTIIHYRGGLLSFVMKHYSVVDDGCDKEYLLVHQFSHALTIHKTRQIILKMFQHDYRL